MAEIDKAEHNVGRGMRTLIDWAVAVRPDAIPPAVMRKAVVVIADNLAAIVAAQDEPEVKCVHEQLLEAGGRAEATIFRAKSPRTDRISAALANGIAGSWCELDEGYRLAPCHAGLYTLPVLLAEAETLNLGVAETLRAAVLAYEITSRFARCWIFPQLTLHPHPQTAAIGGAAASGLARGLDAQRLTDAITAASTLITVGDYRHAVDGALVRNVWAAVGSVNGMRAADWARCGIGGLMRGPYAVYTELLGQPPAPQYLVADLGEEWAITKGYHKLHACCQSTHSAVEAMLSARDQAPRTKRPQDIERVVLETHRPGMSNKAPATTLAAKFSFEHVLAAANVYGHAGHEAFAQSTLDDPDVKRLRERVELTKFEPVLPRPHDRPARLTLHYTDGTTASAECLSARGGPDQPFEETVILGKIESITSDVYPHFSPTVREMLAPDSRWPQAKWPDAVGALTAA